MGRAGGLLVDGTAEWIEAWETALRFDLYTILP